jgi:RNA polymerase sigma factor (sigma-70 family)
VDEVAVAFNALTNAEEVAMAVPCEVTSASSLAEESEIQSVVREALDMLPDTKREVCRLRWGIGDIEPMSLHEIGRVLGLSTERVRNIETEGKQFLARCSLAGRMRELLVEA